MDEVFLNRTDIDVVRIFGDLIYEGVKVCDTLELPWRDNTPFYSCIPEGKYPIKYSESHHNSPCFEILNVTGRMGCLIHAANRVTQLSGCIALGIRQGEDIKGGTSKPAVEALGAFLKEGFLVIRNKV